MPFAPTLALAAALVASVAILAACGGAPRNAQCARAWSTCTDHCADGCEGRPEVLPGGNGSATVDTWSSNCDVCVGRCRDEAASCDARAEQSLP